MSNARYRKRQGSQKGALTRELQVKWKILHNGTEGSVRETEEGVSSQFKLTAFKVI